MVGASRDPREVTSATLPKCASLEQIPVKRNGKPEGDRDPGGPVCLGRSASARSKPADLHVIP